MIGSVVKIDSSSLSSKLKTAAFAVPVPNSGWKGSATRGPELEDAVIERASSSNTSGAFEALCSSLSERFCGPSCSRCALGSWPWVFGHRTIPSFRQAFFSVVLDTPYTRACK
eukprot:970454-Rhodomonas_salina.1